MGEHQQRPEALTVIPKNAPPGAPRRGVLKRAADPECLRLDEREPLSWGSTGCAPAGRLTAGRSERGHCSSSAATPRPTLVVRGPFPHELNAHGRPVAPRRGVLLPGPIHNRARSAACHASADHAKRGRRSSPQTNRLPPRPASSDSRGSASGPIRQAGTPESCTARRRTISQIIDARLRSRSRHRRPGAAAGHPRAARSAVGRPPLRSPSPVAARARAAPVAGARPRRGR
jgi:hypothetical protein